MITGLVKGTTADTLTTTTTLVTRQTVTMASLETIPLEVLLEVTKHLDFGEVLALSTLNRAMKAFAQPMTVASDETKRTFFLRAERFPQHSAGAGRLTCFTCWRLLPRDAFGDGEATGRKGKWAAAHHRRFAGHRFCWTCAAAHRLYPDNQAIRKGPHLWYLCHDCGLFKLRSQRCERNPQPAVAAAADGRPRVDRICTPPLAAPAPSPLERLPAALQQRVFGHLGYRDAVMLAQTSRRLQGAVDPQAASLGDKVDFVRAQHAAHGAAAFHACYACFRVRHRARFTADQFARADDAARRGAWRRLIWTACRRCATRAWDASTAEGRAARAAWEARRWCWRCTGVVAGEADWLAAENCCRPCAARDDVVAARGEVRAARRRAAEAAEAAGDAVLDGVAPWVAEQEEQRERVEAAMEAWRLELQSRLELAQERRRQRLQERQQEQDREQERRWEQPRESLQMQQQLLGQQQERQQERFQAGRMSTAELSLYRRIQAMVRPRREREREQRRRMVHDFVAESAQRLRGLLLGASA